MPEPEESMADMACQVRTALASGDLRSFGDLLDPDVTWGAPGARPPSCSNRGQVLAWYERGRDAGISAEVCDVSVLGHHLLVSLLVGGNPAAQGRGGKALRWQVLTVRRARFVDIVGFDDRTDALAHMAGDAAGAGGR